MRKPICSDRSGQSDPIFNPEGRGEQLRRLIRADVLATIRAGAARLLKTEVLELCGEAFSRKGPESLYRGGSAPGLIFWEGQRVPIRRPRVRGNGREVGLKTYRDLQSLEAASEEISRLLIAGVSSRDYGPAMARIAQVASISKSQVSEAFQYATRKHLDQINGRNVSAYRFVVLFFDGIEFAGTTVVVGRHHGKGREAGSGAARRRLRKRPGLHRPDQLAARARSSGPL